MGTVITINYVRSLFLILTTVFLSSCNRSSDGGDFALLESGGKGAGACKIVSTKPENRVFRVGSTATNKNQFIVQANSETCIAEYVVNDVVVKADGLIAEIASSEFKPSENKVKVNLGNSTGSESFEWTITKNNPPTCNSQTPANLSPSMSAGSSLQLTVQSTDADNDPLQFNWKYNGVANATLLVPLISASTASQISFQPTPANGGTQSISADVTDGYDTVACTWSVRVTGDCSITGKAPDVSGNNVRVLSPSATQNSFSVSTATAGCDVNWTINGAPVSGAQSAKILNSSQFAVGNNVLTASVTGAIGTASQTWNVVKNSVPSCGAMSPSNLSTQTIGIGQSLNLGLVATDTNNDALTFDWQLNTTAVSSSILSTSASGYSASASFLPTITQVGANSIFVNINDGFETTSCSWPVQVLPACDISSSTPSHTVNQRYAGASSQVSTFTVTPNYPANCSVAWAIDGTAVGVGNVYNAVSTHSLLAATTPHSLTATVSNGVGSSVTRTWTLIKNTPPVCNSQTPAATGVSYSSGSGAKLLTANVSDADSDSLNFTWALNGSTSVALTTLGNTATTSSANFTPDISNVGTNLLTVAVNDGYDTTQCTWSINVTGACSLSAFSPGNGSSIPIGANDVVGKTLSITATNAACPVSWKIRGVAVTGTQATKIFDSSYFLAGANAVDASITDGSAVTTTSWTVYKNTPPSGVVSPSNGSAINLSLSTPYNFTVDTSDIDVGDTIAATWKLNGIPIASLSPALTNAVISAIDPFQSSFTFDANYTGSRQLSLSVSDGLDTTSFAWDLAIFSNCSVASSFPAGATQRVSSGTSVTTTYGVIPNDSSCAVSWTLNGAAFGANGNLKDVNSTTSGLGASNTLIATLSNGVGTPATRTWTVAKNSAPTCQAGQTPAATGNIMNYDSTLNLACTASDSESDPVTFAWKLNNNTISGIFDTLTAVGANSSSRFNPASVGYVGNGQVISNTFTDGWDSGFCQWSVDVKDPAAVQIQACSPIEGGVGLLSQYSASPLLYDIKTFTVSATGPNITYRWKTGPDLSNLSVISGKTTAQLKVSTNGSNTYTGATPDVTWASGTRPLVVDVVDQYNNVASCQWSLKRNSAPTINTAQSGTNGTGYTVTLNGAAVEYNSKVRIGYASSMAIRVYGTDSDTGDAAILDYRWKINDQLLPVGGSTFLTHTEAGDKSYSTATISPSYNTSYLGSYKVGLQISDGSEIKTIDFLVEINMFSDECNTLYNSPATGTGNRGGQVCTIVGQAGLGADRKPALEPSKMRFQPWDFAFDGNNILFTEQNSHSIFYYNRGTSSSDDVVRFGKSIPFGQVVAISGLGNSGVLPNMTTIASDFKYSSPRQIAYYGGRAYVADFANNRIVVIKEDGVAESFVGRLSDNTIPANAAASNSTSGTAAGTTQRCEEASGVAVVNESGTYYLYFGCRYAIKKAYIHDPANVNYGKTQVVAGKLNPAGDNGAGREDGAPLTVARIGFPRTFDLDNNGNLYWTEAQGSVRVLNRSGAELSFFGGRYISGVTTLQLSDFANSGGTLGSTIFSKGNILSAVNASLNGATKVVVNGPMDTGGGTNLTVGVNFCYPMRVQLQDASNNTAKYGSNVDVTMSANDAAFSFYSSFANCVAGAPTQTAFTITTGSREIEFWAKANVAVTGKTITATSSLDPAVATGSTGAIVRSLATTGSATNTVIGLSAQPNMHFQDCARVWVVPGNGANPTNPANTVAVRLVTYNGGNFYASNDPTCTGTPITSLTFSGGATSYSEGFLYFARTTRVPAGSVGTLFGSQNATLGSQQNLAISPGTPALGTMQFRQGYGFQVSYSGSNILGFYMTSYDYDVVTYVNDNDSLGTQVNTQYVGGATFGTSDSTTGLYHTHKLVGGSSDSCSGGIPTISNYGLIAPSYNGDSKLGIASRLCYAAGLIIDSAGDYLYMGDLWNWRIRKMKISSGADNSILGTELGQGRGRFGWFGDAVVPAQDATLIFPTDVAYDSTGKTLLISDMGNGRIRKLNLVTGEFETHIGKGVGDMTVPVEDPYAMFLGGPGQIAIYKKTTPTPIDMVLFTDARVYQSNGGAAVNTTCAIRSYNRDLANNRTVFGEEVPAGRVANLAGVYDFGCNSVGSQAGSDTYGGYAANSSLRMPVGIVTDNTSIYLSDFLDHCIYKIDSTGRLTNFIGSCGSSGSSDGIGNSDNASNPTRVTYPMQMAMDPANPTNFFYTEGYNQTTGKIHYANTTGTAVSFATGSAIGKSAGDVGTTTVWNFSVAGTQTFINGIAAFDKYVCVSSGGQQSNSPYVNQTQGGHGVYCFDRTDVAGNAVRVIGSNPSTSTRAGSTLGKDAELKAGSLAYLYQPHGLAFDADGNLYISERGSHVVRMVRRWW
jgi:hypothetical protein